MLTIPEKIKELLHTDSVKKNIRIHFPNGERQDICNDLIVGDSVKFTESLCSQDTLKFGLCESPIFECETVGVGNIVGLTIEVYSEIFCDLSVEGSVFRTDIQETVYPIPLGEFVIVKCDRQSDILHRKITAYSQISLSLESLNNPMNIAKIKTAEYPYSTKDLKQNAMALICSEIPGTAFKMFEKTEFYPTQFMGRWAGIRNKVIKTSEPNPRELRFAISVRSCFTDSYAVLENPESYLIGYEGNDYVEKHLEELFDSLYNQAVEYLDNHSIYLADYEALKEMIILGLKDELTRTLWVFVHFNNLAEIGAIYSDKKNVIYPYANVEGSSQMSVSIEEPYMLRITEATQLGTIATESFEDQIAKLYEFDTSGISNIPISIAKNLAKIPGYNYRYSDTVDLRKQYDAATELTGEFGRIERDGTFGLVNIKQQFGLTPSEELYPSETLYPEGPVGEAITMSDYQKCEYPENYERPFGLVACTFKDSQNQDIRYELWLDGFNAESDPLSYQTYDITNNEIIKNSTWTQSQIEAFCNTIADNIDGVTYVPMQLVGRGLPYVETGDTVSVQTKANDSITTILLNRTMQGEIALTDTFTSK